MKLSEEQMREAWTHTKKAELHYLPTADLYAHGVYFFSGHKVENWMQEMEEMWGQDDD